MFTLSTFNLNHNISLTLIKVLHCLKLITCGIQNSSLQCQNLRVYTHHPPWPLPCEVHAEKNIMQAVIRLSHKTYFDMICMRQGWTWSNQQQQCQFDRNQLLSEWSNSIAVYSTKCCKWQQEKSWTDLQCAAQWCFFIKQVKKSHAQQQLQHLYDQV